MHGVSDGVLLELARAAGAVRIEYVTAGQVRAALTAHNAEDLRITPAEVETMLEGAGEEDLWRQYVDAGLNLNW